LIAVVLMSASVARLSHYGQTISLRARAGLRPVDVEAKGCHVTEVVSWRVEASGVWLVTLDRGPANALHPEILDGLHAAVDAAEAAGDVRVMVIASALPGFFAAGADVKHLATIDAESFMAYGDAMRAANDRLAAAPWVSIAAVDGLALGGGLELAMACTLRVSGTTSAFGLPEVKLGLIPGAGGTQRLPRLVGRGRALDIMLTARQVPAAEALAIGLVDRVAEGDVVEAALGLACELAGSSLPAQLAVVRSVDASFEMSLAEGSHYEADQESGLFSDGEAAEGIAAFVEKRRPVFR
jgi:enoyl-CoA hydratase/carnithine racemase